MDRLLTLAEFEAKSADYDRDVLSCTAIDGFCSSSYWILPAHNHLMGDCETRIFHEENHWAVFGLGIVGEGIRLLQPFESAWGFTSPLVYQDPSRMASLCSRWLHQIRGEWDIVILSGIDGASPLFAALVQELGSHFDMRLGTPTRRLIGDIGEGAEKYLAQRTRGFRKNLRVSLKKADALKLCYETPPLEFCDANALFERVLSVEKKSWKGLEDAGIVDGDFSDFYRSMVARMVQNRNLRLTFIKHGEFDIAYVLGGLFGKTYRGLQFSFDQEYKYLGPGSLCQWHEVQAMAAQGYRAYDLGSDIAYKTRWADRHFDTEMVLVYNR